MERDIMGVLEELIKNKEDLVITFLKIIEGKEAKAKINLDGVKFMVGETEVKLDGSVEFSVIPLKKKE
ncbi:MAG: hypothetical protein GXO64_01030 [Candidatus Micrarchaeota archaeon]|nr:hypothetical protein [Candidatus Micrarchaeota archaeon]